VTRTETRIETRIETLITRLVQQAPALEADALHSLVLELERNAAPLALSIARVLQLVGANQIDQGIALPALAMACGTLVDPRLTAREHDAARFEIETLLPMPGTAPRIAVPDVPIAQLIRGPRRQP